MSTSHVAAQAAREFTAQQLHATHPHLVPAGNNPLIAAAKNIRAELKRAFPSVTFSVRTRRFAGGNAIDVEYTDGPVTEQVTPIIDRYSAGFFDGMTDSYEDRQNAWTDAFGRAKYVHVNRRHSDRALAAATRTVFTRYPGNLQGIEVPSVEDLRRGRLWNVNVPGLNDDLASLIFGEASRRTWAIAKP